jgi:hypothetical protein
VRVNAACYERLLLLLVLLVMVYVCRSATQSTESSRHSVHIVHAEQLLQHVNLAIRHVFNTAKHVL